MKLLNVFRTVRGRIQYGSLLLSVVPVVIIAIVIAALALESAKGSLSRRAQDQLVSLRAVKQTEIQGYFESLKKTISVLAKSPEVLQSTKALESTYNDPSLAKGFDIKAARSKLESYYVGAFTTEYNRRNPGSTVDMKSILAQLPDAAVALQYHYIANNPNPLGNKNKLNGAVDDTSAYTQTHTSLQPFINEVIDEFGFYDVFLADLETGNIVYTYFKELDFTTSLLNGPYAKTLLGEAFRASRDATSPDFVYLSDFAPYLPSYEDQAAFMSTPIFDGNRKVGVLLVQVPIDQINKTMTFDRKWKDAGLGESGEIYLVGSDSTPRSISRFLIEAKDDYLASLASVGVSKEIQDKIKAKDSNIGLQPMKTAGIEASKKGETGFAIYPDYRNIPVLGAYSPINILGQKWVMLSEIDQAEAFAPIDALFKRTIYASLIALVILLVIVGFFVTRLTGSINRPLATLQSTVIQLTQGDMAARTKMESLDELGDLGRALDKLLDERVASLSQAAKENEQLNNSVIDIMQAVSRLSSRDLTVRVPVNTDVTGAISDALNLMTRETTRVLRQVNDISTKVAEASNRVHEGSESTRLVAEKGSEEIKQASSELEQAAFALREIADRAKRADIAAEEAIKTTRQALTSVRETVGGISTSRDVIRETEKRIKRLGERSQEISSAVNLINTIAERTSMLALNTSMQAVAAGEAGRAYAVVADEVKRLAESARAATQQIANLVGAIQSETVDTVDAINRAITQIVEISKMAERAGEQMRSTEEKTDQLVTSVRDIATTTEAQSKVSAVLQNRAQQIQEASRLTTEQLASQTKETENLNEYAANLVESVRVFTLPA